MVICTLIHVYFVCSLNFQKQIPRVAKGSELQAQLNLAQEDLKKAKEQLVQAEKEKEKAIGELSCFHEESGCDNLAEYVCDVSNKYTLEVHVNNLGYT